MRILFITRKYPPIEGGMERYSKELFEALSGVADVSLYANIRGNPALPGFLLAAAGRIASEGARYDLIHFGDGLLAALIPVARIFARVPVSVTVHGLDVTYGNPLYKATILPLLRTADRIVCVSSNTRDLCLARGIAAEKLTVIPNGIASHPGITAVRPAALPHEEGKWKLLCSVGRLVKRKGHEWFLREVMCRLDSAWHYAIAGDGPERDSIERAVAKAGLGARVHVLGTVKASEKEWLLANSRLFVMPNIAVKEDVEGFGLALTEAASRGLMSVASRIDGIPDAVIPGKTGILVTPLDPVAFVEAIEAAVPDRGRTAAAAEAYSWDRIITRYLAEFERITVEARTRKHRRKVA